MVGAGARCADSLGASAGAQCAPATGRMSRLAMKPITRMATMM
jgi:hypothetical protein